MRKAGTMPFFKFVVTTSFKAYNLLKEGKNARSLHNIIPWVSFFPIDGNKIVPQKVAIEQVEAKFLLISTTDQGI
jgi:hypothetical protein